jgi:CheY-like chemotaxis protein
VVHVSLDPINALGSLDSFQPDLAILDIGLPVMDGYQLARALRAQLGTSVTLFALSGYAQEKDRQLSREAGSTCTSSNPPTCDR